MNIQEAKEQIKYAMTAYFAKDELGNYEIPLNRQRPVFLVGAPGIGKTAIMEQIAEELGVILVSYSMTHHTRQSALGLPYIAQKDYRGEAYQVSEYTMSEIISSVYDAMEATGLAEGILFLDEINCVSETLTPSMLQFLQYKTFGRHALPEGWIVVTAGNPPEYNRTVREFDIVTLDRLKKIEVEPDLEAWKQYAFGCGVHPSILTYLEIKKNHFYHVETKAGGKSFVTARGWEDLSRMIRICEKKDLPVNKKLISQYLQDAKIAGDFASYYDLFRKYRSDYQIEAILRGTAGPEISSRAASARFDERIAFLGLLVNALSEKSSRIREREDVLSRLLASLKEMKPYAENGEALDALIRGQLEKTERGLLVRQKSGTLSVPEKRAAQLAMERLSAWLPKAEGFADLKGFLQEETLLLSREAESLSQEMKNAFTFLEETFSEGQELLLFVTELTVDPNLSRFLSHYRSAEYERHSRSLQFHSRSREIAERMEQIKQ